MARTTRIKRNHPTTRATEHHETWSVGFRVAASIALATHVFAVFVAPLSSPPPASQLARQCADFLSPYLHAAFLNHGYRFFAPDPGPSHLIGYELELADGSMLEGRFPDPQQHWPRLLYHRRFMVSESVFSVTEPYIAPPPEGALGPEEMQQFERARASADRLVRSIARELIQRHSARRAKLYLLAHGIPAPWDVAAGMPLDDASLFDRRPLGEFEGASD